MNEAAILFGSIVSLMGIAVLIIDYFQHKQVKQ